MIKLDAGFTGAVKAQRARSNSASLARRSQGPSARQRKTADADSMITENDDGAGTVISARRKAGQDEPGPVRHAPERRRQQA
jgi:hypothetical protein